ncbi:MAG: hypothetical protein GYA15_10575 [Leptolinea sp.]|jgi:hypothetical protein|nr:hypothetical protein [Leptolinea sp.]
MGYTLTLPMTENLWFKISGLTEDDIPHRWTLDTGRHAGHCPDCLSLDGEVRTLAEWQNSVMPGSACLQCGSGCRCSLQPTLDMPTEYTIDLPFGPRETLNRALIFRDCSRQWRYNFTEVLYGNRPFAPRPGRSPAASLPVVLAAEPRRPWDEPQKKTTARKPVHGVD